MRVRIDEHYKNFFLPVLFIGCLSSCHKLDLPVTTEVTPDIFPNDSVQFIEAAQPAYIAFRGNYALDYWFMQSLSTDEAILPARGGNWYDNQNYRALHYHSWTKDHGWTNTCWSWLATVTGTVNQALHILNQNEPAGASKQTHLAELRMLRAVNYFMWMDLYGSIPLDTTYDNLTPYPNLPRPQVFQFIGNEVLESLPYLNPASGISTYGRANKYTAFALLAKMYLNAEYYTGIARYNDCIAACDSIINSGKYALETNYLNMFNINNGPQIREFIFAVPYDAGAQINTTALPVTGYMYHARYDIPRSLKKKYSLSFTPSAPESTLPSFFAYYNDPNDTRNQQWLTGLQYYYDGTPVTVHTTHIGYDFTYADPATRTDTIVYQVKLTPDILLRLDPTLFDCGNDEIAWNMGYRNVKFHPDSTSTTRNQNNDVPVFRYSDVLLMKAEAILRGGTATLGQTALSLANQLRSVRTTSPAWSAITLDSIYNERNREFAWEGWHRNDMIRFGKYEGAWGFKTDTDPHHRVYPIPTSALQLNPKLTQNAGY